MLASFPQPPCDDSGNSAETLCASIAACANRFDDTPSFCDPSLRLRVCRQPDSPDYASGSLSCLLQLLRLASTSRPLKTLTGPQFIQCLSVSRSFERFVAEKPCPVTQLEPRIQQPTGFDFK
jgi:hypothetical protein